MMQPPEPVSLKPPPLATHGVRLWTQIEEVVRQIIGDDPFHPRQLVLNVPLVSKQPGPASGDHLISLCVGSINCRIVAYQMWALTPGSITIDIERSTPATQAAPSGGTPYRFPTVTGSAANPSLNGSYAENLDTSAWTNRELNAGDMLHVWCVSADATIQHASMALYLQDTSEHTAT